MAEQIYQLVYVSTASELLDEPTLMTMLADFRTNNHRRGVTGLMLYCDGNILQLLEGEETVVEDLFCIITADPRHEAVTLLYSGTREQRDFPDWNMGFQRLELAELPLTPEGFSRMAENPSAADVQVDAMSPEVRVILQAFRQASRI